jgi:mRNA-degrading endonuclease RelE of RelBE toxin-antitoxin system
MKVEYSKDFEKSVRKLSGKLLRSVSLVVQEVQQAEQVEQITNCKKLVGYDNVYRIRIGDYRAFFVLHVIMDEGVVRFLYLVSRGEAYKKKSQVNLQAKDV